MSGTSIPEPRFLTDRMLGTLTRYLRFMGYDTMSANALTPGSPGEDSRLLEIARSERRILLTRDRELARRGGTIAVFLEHEEPVLQVNELSRTGLVEPRLRLTRCSLCNEPLRRARSREIRSSPYAPESRDDQVFYWCRRCRKLYWAGSHVTAMDRLFCGNKK